MNCPSPTCLSRFNGLCCVRLAASSRSRTGGGRGGEDKSKNNYIAGTAAPPNRPGAKPGNRNAATELGALNRKVKAHLRLARAILRLARAEIVLRKGGKDRQTGLFTLMQGGVTVRHKAVVWRRGGTVRPRQEALPETNLTLCPPAQAAITPSGSIDSGA
jgi:hypothetical protein